MHIFLVAGQLKICIYVNSGLLTIHGKSLIHVNLDVRIFQADINIWVIRLIAYIFQVSVLNAL